MGLFRRDPQQEHQRKLDMFRRDFLRMIADGTYPPERQQRLYRACANIQLDWHQARVYVLPHALNLFRYTVEQMLKDGNISAQEIRALQALQRRLGIPEQHAKPLQTLYSLIEQKITALIAERAAYMSAAPAVADIKAQIGAYGLPAEIKRRLDERVDKQHELAKLMAGIFPAVVAPVTLYRDEICHFHAAAQFVPTHKHTPKRLPGIIVVTNQRLLFVSAGGGFAARWTELETVSPSFDYQLIAVSSAQQRGVVYCPDVPFQWLATLISATQRCYAMPTPVPRVNKRLTPA